MSLTADSPVPSSSTSSGDDFAALLDAELDSASDVSPDPEADEVDEDEDSGHDSAHISDLERYLVKIPKRSFPWVFVFF